MSLLPRHKTTHGFTRSLSERNFVRKKQKHLRLLTKGMNQTESCNFDFNVNTN